MSDLCHKATPLANICLSVSRSACLPVCLSVYLSISYLSLHVCSQDVCVLLC